MEQAQQRGAEEIIEGRLEHFPSLIGGGQRLVILNELNVGQVGGGIEAGPGRQPGKIMQEEQHPRHRQGEESRGLDFGRQRPGPSGQRRHGQRGQEREESQQLPGCPQRAADVLGSVEPVAGGGFGGA